MQITRSATETWTAPVMHPAASGQLDPAAEFAGLVPPAATVREPLTIGADPGTGRPLQVRLWDPRDGAKVVMVTAKTGGGTTVLLDDLTERVTACDDAVLLQASLSSAPDGRDWEPLAAASAPRGDAARALRILAFAAALITERRRGDRAARVHQPTAREPLYVLAVDGVDAVASVPVARQILRAVVCRCRSEGVAVVMNGRVAAAGAGGDVLSQVTTAVFGRGFRERGPGAALPSLGDYGAGHPGVFGVAVLPADDSDFARGRAFWWGDPVDGMRRLIAARAAGRRPHQLEPALHALQPLWDAIASPRPDDGKDAGGVRPGNL
jgi:hypothetical protein